jgi:uncharacterized protein
VGRALCRQLAGGEHQVTVLSRRPEEVRDLPAGARAARWDGRSASGWEQLAEGADAIINLAGANLGEGRWSPERKQEIMASRLNSGHAVVEAVEKAGQKPEVVIQASAVGYYGPRGDEEVTEQTEAGEDFPAQVCIRWEASTRPVEAMGVRQTIIRSGLVLNREEGALPRMELPFKLFAGGPIGSGKQGFPWIHIEDEARAILWLVDQGGPGAYNLTSPRPISNADFAKAMGKAMSRPSFVPVPAFALKAMFGEMSGMLLTGQRAVPRRLLEEGFEFRYPDVDSALRNLYR